jgi:lysophospholipase L1-like esterase
MSFTPILTAIKKVQQATGMKPPDSWEEWHVDKSALTMSTIYCTQIAGKIYNMAQADLTRAPEVGTDVDTRKYFKLRPSFPAENMLASGLTLAQPYTISFVVRQLSFVDGYYLFNTQSGAYGVSQKRLSGADDTLTIGAGVANQANPQELNKLNQRLFVAFVMDGANSKMIVNGDATNIANPGTLGLINPSIGRSSAFGNYDFFNVRVYNKRLTDVELLTLWKSEKSYYSIPELNRHYGFGDSIAYGGTYGVHSFLTPVVKGIADVYINYAVPGARLRDATYKGLINQYRDKKSILDKSKKIFIQLGTNDITASDINAQWNIDFRVIVQEMISDGFTPSNIYLTTPPYKSTQVAQRNQIKAYYDQMATDFGVHSVDMIAPTLAGGGDTLLTDGTHPNAAGVAIMAATLTAAL